MKTCYFHSGICIHCENKRSFHRAFIGSILLCCSCNFLPANVHVLFVIWYPVFYPTFDYFPNSRQRPSFYSQFRPLGTTLRHKYLILKCATALGMTEEIPPHFLVGVCCVKICLCTRDAREKHRRAKKKQTKKKKQDKNGTR